MEGKLAKPVEKGSYLLKSFNGCLSLQKNYCSGCYADLSERSKEQIYLGRSEEVHGGKLRTGNRTVFFTFVLYPCPCKVSQ